MSEIFGPNSLKEFKNKIVNVTEVRSEQFGLCYALTSITSRTLKASQF